jgi:hypothetical protein
VEESKNTDEIMSSGGDKTEESDTSKSSSEEKL